MAETLTPHSDERDELAALEAKLASKRQEVETKESFGKFDYTVPAEDEDTYTSYMENRPSDGVVPDGEGFRNAENGTFASEGDYVAGKESEGVYYTRQFEDAGEDTYEAMSMKELAENLYERQNDRSTSDEIMHVLQTKVDTYAEKYGWDEGQKTAHMDTLLEIATNGPKGKAQEVTTPEEKNPAIEDAEAIGEALKRDPDVANNSDVKTSLDEVRRELDAALGTQEERDALAAMQPVHVELGDGSGDVLVASAEDDAAEKLKAATPVHVELGDDGKTGEDAEELSDAEKAARDALAAAVPIHVELGGDKKDKEASGPDQANEDDEGEEEKNKKSKFSLARRAYARLGAMVTQATHGGVERLRTGSKMKTGLAIGAAALVGGVVAWKLGAFDHVNGSNTPNPPDSFPAPKGSGPGGNGIEHHLPAFSPEAKTIDPGEGWLNELADLHVPEDQRQAMLDKILSSKNPGIQDWTYQMQNGDPGIARPGKIPASVLESIEELRNQ